MYFRIFAEVLSDVQGMAVPQVLADAVWMCFGIPPRA
jgi:hypothetical protein